MPIHRSRSAALLAVAPLALPSLAPLAHAQWSGYANDPQHSAISAVPSEPLAIAKWQTPVDINPPYSGSYLFAHYGSPLVTPNNTVIVPVRNATGNFQLSAFDARTGTPRWTAPSDYSAPASGNGFPTYEWLAPYSPTLTPAGQVAYPGAGGTLFTRSSLDAASPSAPTRLSPFGIDNYNASPALFNASIAISTPITSDAQGNLYFGYVANNQTLPGVNNNQPLGSGIARISSAGVGSFFQAKDLQVNGSPAGLNQVVMNAAPALSHDGATLYVPMSVGDFQGGRMVALNAATLAPVTSAPILDPFGNLAPLYNDGTSSPTVGPDGHVYFGAQDTAGFSRGWLTHFTPDLATQKPSGGFGWDITPSIIPAAMVPSYTGTSPYLLLTKYNNYAGFAGDGINMLAILDPNDSQPDTRANATSATIMKEILKIAGPTPDPEHTDQYPNAVKEWCINTAAVDPATSSVLVNSEDGKIYRWSLVTNTLTEVVTLTQGLLEAYTPTAIGPDGTVYAINDARLFAVGNRLYPTFTSPTGNWSNPANWSTASQPTTNFAPKNNTPDNVLYLVTLPAGAAVTLDTPAAITSLTLAQTATLNLTTNALAIQSTSPTEKSAKLPALVAALRSHAITSSSLTENTTLALIDNADLNLASYQSLPLTQNSLLLTRALIGDADLSGTVDLGDFDRWFTHVGSSTFSYAAGDFDLSGIVDLADFDLWFSHIGVALPLVPASPVPEPASLLILFPSTYLLTTLSSRRKALPRRPRFQ